MPEPIEFFAQLWRTTQDNEGATKVTFAVDSSQLGNILQLGTRTGMLLKVRVEVDESGNAV